MIQSCWSRIQKQLTSLWPFLPPVFLWLFLFKNFFLGHLKLIVDAHICFIYTNHYFNHLLRGVFPLWNPFNVWGRADDFGMRMIGEFNPFLYLIAVLRVMGVSFNNAYSLYLISYFFVGVLGFYLLSQRLFKRKIISYVAMLLFMFSNVSGLLFNDLLIVLILIPSIWFFYFLVSFTQEQKVHYFLGVVFSLMIIVTTYIPFHFLTVFLVFFICFSIIYYRLIGGIARSYFKFISSHLIVFIFGCVCFTISLVPGYFWFLESKAGEYYVAWRSAQADPLSLNIKLINLSGLIGPNSWDGLFSYLQTIDINQFYMPIFAFILFGLGAFVRVTRRLVLFLVCGVLIILISLADVTGIHEFLFDHIFFFKYFRNLHFLLWFAYPFFILFVSQQAHQVFLTLENKKSNKGLLIFAIFVGHMLFILFLLSKDSVVISSFLTLILSFVFFVMLITFKKFCKSSFGILFLLAVIILQPIEVFSRIAEKYKGHVFSYAKNPYTFEESKPNFEYVRPRRGTGLVERDTKGFGDVRDTHGFVDWGTFDFGLEGTHVLQTQHNDRKLQEYVRHKFVIYEEAPKEGDLKFTGGQFIKDTSESFSVKEFDINYIKFVSNFNSRKFLIYNDSYHSGWRAIVNGTPREISRSNIAFKGIWLEAGENSVYMHFRSHDRYYLFVGTFFTFLTIFSIILYLFWHETKIRHEKK